MNDRYLIVKLLSSSPVHAVWAPNSVCLTRFPPHSITCRLRCSSQMTCLPIAPPFVVSSTSKHPPAPARFLMETSRSLSNPLIPPFLSRRLSSVFLAVYLTCLVSTAHSHRRQLRLSSQTLRTGRVVLTSPQPSTGGHRHSFTLDSRVCPGKAHPRRHWSVLAFTQVSSTVIEVSSNVLREPSFFPFGIPR